MSIRSYQMHNVLTAFRKQLGRRKISNREKTFCEKPEIGRIHNKFADEKRKTIIDKTTTDIFAKIIHSNINNKSNDRTVNQISEIRDQPESIKFKETKFKYNVIDKNNEKKACVLSLKNLAFIDGGLKPDCKKHSG